MVFLKGDLKSYSVDYRKTKSILTFFVHESLISAISTRIFRFTLMDNLGFSYVGKAGHDITVYHPRSSEA